MERQARERIAVAAGTQEEVGKTEVDSTKSKMGQLRELCRWGDLVL